MLNQIEHSGAEAQTTATKLDALCERARKQFGPYCFWWLSENQRASTMWKPIVKALKTHGGKAGMIAAKEIEETASALNAISERHP